MVDLLNEEGDFAELGEEGEFEVNEEEGEAAVEEGDDAYGKEDEEQWSVCNGTEVKQLEQTLAKNWKIQLIEWILGQIVDMVGRSRI